MTKAQAAGHLFSSFLCGQNKDMGRAIRKVGDNLVHCSACYLGGEMIIAEITISIQRLSSWATNLMSG